MDGKLMKYISGMFLIILLLTPTLINVNTVSAAAEPTLEAELAITDNRENILVDFGKEETISLRFVQNGFNWTKLSERGFFFSKIYLPIMFYSLRYLLGYNSVVFNATVLGNPKGWHAWISPNSVTYFTGESSADLKLYVEVNRPTTIKTATIRISYQAYSGNNVPIGKASNDIQVSVKQYHIAQISALEQAKEVQPDNIVSFPIQVTNLGNYQDTYGFTITNETNGFLGVISDFITLQPGETGTVNAIVSSPYAFFYDFGSKTSLNISAYSIYEPTKKFTTMIQITSRGFELSQPFIFTLSIIIFLILLLYFLYYYFINKKDIEIYGKPIKPWKIPSERQHLNKLKEEDGEQYDKTLKLMKDEYQSAILWFKDYKNNIKSDKGEGSFINNIKVKLLDIFSKVNDKDEAKLDTVKNEKVKAKDKKPLKMNEKSSEGTISKNLSINKMGKQFKSLFIKEDIEGEKEVVDKNHKKVKFEEFVEDEPIQKNYSNIKLEVEKESQARNRELEKIKRKQNKQRKKLKIN